MKNIIISFLSLFLILNIFSCDKFNNKELSKEKLLEMAEKCNKAGKTYFQEFSTSMNSDGINYLWDDPEYHYNKRLNTCLAHVRYIQNNPYESSVSTHYNQTVDVFANKAIIRGWFIRDVKDNTEKILDSHDKVPNYTSLEYFKQKDKLFSE
jgi:hypothetical protein